jgi:hypothetical protein
VAPYDDVEIMRTAPGFYWMVATSSDSASLLSKYTALRTVVSPTPVLLSSTKGALRRFASLGARSLRI